jgi:hypothetical protein
MKIVHPSLSGEKTPAMYQITEKMQALSSVDLAFLICYDWGKNSSGK